MQEALRFQVHPELDDPVLVLAFAGWNDASEAATGTVQFLNEAMLSAPLAEIDPEDFYDFTVARPHLSLEEGQGRRLVWPSTEFRYGQRDPVDFVTALGTEPHMRWSRFCDCVSLLAAIAYTHFECPRMESFVDRARRSLSVIAQFA